MNPLDGQLYEPRNRSARLYTIDESSVNIPKEEAIKKAKLKFVSDYEYSLNQVFAKEVEVTETDDHRIRTILVSVKHSVYRSE